MRTVIPCKGKYSDSSNSRKTFIIYFFFSVDSFGFFFPFSFLPRPPSVVVVNFIGTAAATATAAKSLQSCPTLCDPINGSPPGSPVPGILQARTLEWVAISFSNA